MVDKLELKNANFRLVDQVTKLKLNAGNESNKRGGNNKKSSSQSQSQSQRRRNASGESSVSNTDQEEELILTQREAGKVRYLHNLSITVLSPLIFNNYMINNPSTNSLIIVRSSTVSPRFSHVFISCWITAVSRGVSRVWRH